MSQYPQIPLSRKGGCLCILAQSESVSLDTHRDVLHHRCLLDER